MNREKSKFQNAKYSVLVIYDIVCSKDRYRINKIMESYGVRIQKSAFECFLTETQIKGMKQKLIKKMNPETDRLNIYRFTEYTRVDVLGYKPQVEKKLLLVI